MCQAIARCLALLLITLSGCATWHTPADKPSSSRGLPAPRRDPGGAMLEVAFISINPTAAPQRDPLGAPADSAQPTDLASPDELAEPAIASASDLSTSDDPSTSDLSTSDDPSAGDGSAGEQSLLTPPAPVAADAAPAAEPIDIWHWIDETVVAPQLRHTLRRNGLRIGKAQHVGDFVQRLDQIRRQHDPSSRVLAIADVESNLSHQARQITCRIGKRYELPVRQPAAGDQAVLVTLAGQPLGKTLSQAQPLFALRATTADVHSINLALLPEIQHGAMRQTWVGSDAALRIDNRREVWSLDELATEIRLEKGGILVAGCITPAFGLGQQMFTGTTADGDADQVLMVIRVAELPQLITP